jgi:hypothetical protein
VETIKNHVISGSGQAPVIAIDVIGGVSKHNLIDGLRAGWSKDTKRLLVNWKGQWYQINKQLLFSDGVTRFFR